MAMNIPHNKAYAIFKTLKTAKAQGHAKDALVKQGAAISQKPEPQQIFIIFCRYLVAYHIR